MAVAKLSVSMDASLVKLIRGAASEEGVSLSTWLAQAAEAKARQRALREAMTDFARHHGSLSLDEENQLIDAARKKSVVSRGRRRER